MILIFQVANLNFGHKMVDNDFDFPSCEFKLWSQNGGEKTIENIRQYLRKKKLYHCDYTIVRNVFLRNLYNYLKTYLCI